MKRVVIIFLLSILSFNIAFTQNASYNYATSTGTIGTGYNWIDCSTGGTEITSFSQGNAKNGRQEINWPFAFSFYDDNYTTSDQLSIATNGFIRLDANASASWVGVNAYTLNSGGTGFGQIVALCLYNDNFEDAVSHLYYKTTGSSPNRILTVEYNNVEIERYADKYADVQVSFYETSNKVVIKFGDDNITQVGADMGIHSGVSGYFNKWQEVESGTNNTWIEYTRPVKTFNSIVYNQASTGDVIQNQNNAEIMRIDVKVNGGTGTLNLNSIEITADNDADADIASSGVKLYRTTTTTFSTVNMLGTAQSLSGGTATFSSLSYDLPDGTTYIWAVYDIASSATKGNDVDMSIATNKININGSTYPSSAQNPAGERTIDYIEWEGSISTDWTDELNWTGNNIPTATDDVVIPSGTPFQPKLGNNTVECASITIDALATVTIDGTGYIKLYGSLTNNGTIDQTSGSKNNRFYGSIGTDYIRGTGTYTLVRIKILVDDYYIESDILNAERIVVQDGGKLYLGTQTLIVNDLRLKEFGDNFDVGSGTLEMRTSSFDSDGDLICGINSTVYFSGSIAQTIPSQYTYYNLKAGGTATKSLDANLDVNGDLTIESGSVLSQDGHAINIGGNWTNNGTFTQGTQTVSMDGSLPQTIDGSATTAFYDLTVDNSAGVGLEHAADISHTLTLTDGIINTTAANILGFGSSATVSGGSNSANIAGPIRKDGTSNFVFPTGKGGKYARIEIKNIEAGTNSITAEYFNTPYSNVTNHTEPLTKVSQNEYWRLISNPISTQSADVTLYWEDATWSGIGTPSELRVAQWASTTWVNKSGAIGGSGGATGTVLSSSAITAHGVFTFGTIDNVNNPLPVSLISFDAKKQDDVAVINWQTASEINNDYFIVQRSTNGIDVDDIGRIEGNGNSNILLSYSFIDDMPPFGNVYYRLKQVDYDGKSEIFFWKSLFFGHDIEISIYPNPNTNNVIYFESSNNSEAQIQIYSIGGKLMMEKNLTFASGKAALMHDLAKGYYLIKYFQNNEQIVQKLIIQ